MKISGKRNSIKIESDLSQPGFSVIQTHCSLCSQGDKSENNTELRLYSSFNEGVRERLRLTIVLQDEEVVCEEDGDVRDNGEDPGEKNQPPHVPHSPGGQGADRMNDCQVPTSLSR